MPINRAQKFIDFLGNSTKAGDIGLMDRGIPVNSEVRAAITSKLSPADAAKKALDEAKSALL